MQANNALVVEGKKPVDLALAAFDNYFDQEDDVRGHRLGRVDRISASRTSTPKVAFSPHSSANALLDTIGEDIGKTTSCLFYSLAFLSITPGIIKESLKKVSKKPGIFVYGIADKKVGGIDLQMPNGNIAPVFASALDKNIPAPFNKEPAGGGGNRMHHKFVVIDFDKPTARVYLGSYNFSNTGRQEERREPARDPRPSRCGILHRRGLAHLRPLSLPRRAEGSQEGEEEAPARQGRRAKPGEKPWFAEDYTDPRKIRDRELFS